MSKMQELCQHHHRFGVLLGWPYMLSLVRFGPRPESATGAGAELEVEFIFLAGLEMDDVCFVVGHGHKLC